MMIQIRGTDASGLRKEDTLPAATEDEGAADDGHGSA